MLRQGAGSDLEDIMKVGAAGEISSSVANKHALRRGGHEGKVGAVLSTSIKVDLHSKIPVHEQLKVILVENSVSQQ